MPKVLDIIPVTDLRQDAAAALKRVRSSRQPVVITQRGRATAVILSIEAYERSEHERELLRVHTNVRIIAPDEDDLLRWDGP